MVNKDYLIDIGFKPIPHFTVMDSYIYDLGRCRQLSIGCIGTPNEMLSINEHDIKDHRIIKSVIILHNYDYDGYITRRKLESLINSIGTKEASDG